MHTVSCWLAVSVLLLVGCGGGGGKSQNADIPVSEPVTVESITIAEPADGAAVIRVETSEEGALFSVVAAPVGHSGQTMLVPPGNIPVGADGGQATLYFSHVGAYEVVLTFIDASGQAQIFTETIALSGDGSALRGSITVASTNPDEVKPTTATDVLLQWQPVADLEPVALQVKTVTTEAASFEFDKLAMTTTAYACVIDPSFALMQAEE